jgi:hypothetical protein
MSTALAAAGADRSRPCRYGKEEIIGAMNQEYSIEARMLAANATLGN